MIERDLIFIGGGHSHALVLRHLAMQPIDNVRITLISETPLTPYSGMLPGFLAGHYSLDDIHIDLHRLCQVAKVRFIHDRVIGIDPKRKTIQLQNHAELQYDKVSINTGSTPNLTVPGAKEFAIGVKPISQLAEKWQQLIAQQDKADKPTHWAVIGAGAAGIEVVLAIAHRFKQAGKAIQLSLVFSGEQPLAGYNPRLRKKVLAKLKQANIRLIANFKVAEVRQHSLIGTAGQALSISQSIWCTPATAPNWPKQAGLAVDDAGFIAVNEYLQSTSHGDVFAAGDVASLQASPRAKAGVFAVRSAPFLSHNLTASLTNQAMRPAKLQTDFLSLIALGERQAVGQRHIFSFAGNWVWRWKDSIDQNFMQLFKSKLPAMKTMTNEPMHCAGCGSKLGPELLAQTLKELNGNQAPLAEDACLAFTSEQHQLWQSIDGFRSFSDDDYRFGQVITHHAVNDCYAMGIEPATAQVWANLAFSHPRIAQRDFKFLMAGILNALQEHKTQLIGGHSTEGVETHVGLVVNGIGKACWPKNGIQENDWLLLNKGIGSGVLLAAIAQGKAPAHWVEQLWQQLLTSNRGFFQQLKALEVHAATDVTGFGLVGHLLEMTQNTQLSIRLNLDSVPVFTGAVELSQQGIASSLFGQLEPLKLQCAINNPAHAKLNLLFDPQTQGGLLVSVPANVGALLVEQSAAVKIAEVVPRSEQPLILN